MGYITDIRFMGETGWLLHELSVEGNSFGVFHTLNSGIRWTKSEFEGVSGSYYLVGWEMRSPYRGVAIVGSDSGFPFEGDINRETAYWVMETQNGRNWNITKSIERGDDEDFKPNTYLSGAAWDKPSSAWSISESNSSYVIERNGMNMEQITVLQLPKGTIWSASRGQDR